MTLTQFLQFNNNNQQKFERHKYSKDELSGKCKTISQKDVVCFQRDVL